MSKESFLKQLKTELSGMEPQELKDVMADYEEYFEAGKEDGRREDEIAKSLGDPKAIASQLKVSSKIKKAETNYSVTNITRAVLATLGLGMFNLIFIVGPFFGMVGVLMGLFAAGIAAFAAGFVGVIVGLTSWVSPHFVTNFIYTGVHPTIVILFSLAAICFGILFVIGCCYLAKWFYLLTVNYLKFNLRVITGDKE